MKMANYKEDNSSRKAYVQIDNQSKVKKNRKPLLITIFVIIVMLALGGFGYYQYDKAKQEQQILKQELQILKRKLERQLMQYEKSGSRDGHDYVDLGLPSGLKWATCNVGADFPEKYGNYYAWGEVSWKSEYTEDNSITYGKNITDIKGSVLYDAARANWGGTWRLPTKADLQELVDKCLWEWTKQNDVEGYKITGPNGNSIFLPAAGYRYGSSLFYAGELGYYWSSTPNESGGYRAYLLGFGSSELYVGNSVRRRGLSVRPVSE